MAEAELTFVHGVTFQERFKKGDAERKVLLTELESVTNSGIKNDGFYNFANLLYSEQQDLQAVLEFVQLHLPQDRQNQFRTTIALNLLEKNKLKEAREVMSGVVDDRNGYGKVYEREMKKRMQKAQIEHMIIQYEKEFGKYQR